MDYKKIVNKIKPELDKVVAFLERELMQIRTSRASISLVEDIKVECFGKTFPLQQLGAISIPKSREILIQPWDQSYVEPIVAALSKSSLGVNPVVADSNLIRLILPPLSAEYRENLMRLISEKREQARQTIRKWRGEAWDEVQDLERKGEIREDDKFKAKDELQDLVDEYNKKIEEAVEKKKKEITTT